MVVRDYYVQVDPVPQAEGGGLLGCVPDLPGCMSDGDDIAMLELNIADAIETWIAAARRLGRAVPSPAAVQERRA
ncbi:type II toxin-antitoxin system HicB family antitoxin [Methylobacterium trifolii]|uniref:HicB-like antitoxin of toxin-antitoxin system domain-containing protein n=1 Tax=Methylobacterium trifolii TaxID=1003092 RepID=A0ABQ4U7W4_9HYPH|nr:type II toxin-antitoxin system HicB family antitoxin [Methylobacterium trifolii]GJE61925.1 hypothetical protein MPOCJGCO_4053 [Methylobacterium trifolii]